VDDIGSVREHFPQQQEQQGDLQMPMLSWQYLGGSCSQSAARPIKPAVGERQHCSFRPMTAPPSLARSIACLANPS